MSNVVVLAEDSKRGYWADHNYSRRSVANEEEPFLGWDKMVSLCNRLFGDKNKVLLATIFLTGGRITEVLNLRKSNFYISSDSITVKNMSLLKNYDKKGSWTEWKKKEDLPTNELRRLYKFDDEKDMWFRNRFYTEGVDTVRKKYAFPIDEALTHYLLDWLDIRKDEDYLFYGRNNVKPLSYSQAYKIINNIGYYPHFFRSQRACCLVNYYKFDISQLMEWFTWTEITTAQRYFRTGSDNLLNIMQNKSNGIKEN